MVNRNIYDTTIEKIEEIYSHYEGFDAEDFMNQLSNVKDNFDIKLMLVGHFSAGKSSLLNMLIGKPDFLKEAQEPQTAIATEIIFNEEESAYAFDEAGKREIINPQKEYTPKEYNHLEYRVNSPALEKISDFTIVDTPGFDAGIETHAKALASYIGMGSAYLVVIDQEKGGIDETTLEFIQEISNYSSQIAVLINKCDKITSEIAESIAESARFTLDIHGLNYKVYICSKREANISDKLVDIISTFNAQKAFDKIMVRRLKTELLSMEKMLSVIQNRIFLDTFDLDVDIAKYTRLEKNLSNAFEKKREDARDDLEKMVQEVTNKIRSTLIAKSDSVVEALLSGNQVAAEAIIVETVRPIMLETMKNISARQVDRVIDVLDFNGLITDGERVYLTDIAVNLANNLKNLIEEGIFETNNSVDAKKSKQKKQNKDIYRVITGITAITTDVIAPWLEIVIVLLPDVINFLRGILGESDSQLAKRRFVNNVVPQITNKMYPQIRQNVEETAKIVLDEYEKMFTNKIEGIKKNIIEAQNKKEKRIQEFEEYKTAICEDKVSIQKLLNELG